MKLCRVILVIILLSSILVGCGKPTLPIRLRVHLDKSEYSKDEDIKFDVSFDFLDDKPKSAKIEIKTEGDIKINGDKDYIYSNVNDIDNKNITIELLKPYTNGYGKINATLYTYDKGGRDLYAISRSLYYHISDEGVLLSINSLYELERRHVDKLLEAGKIDKKQHRELMDELARKGNRTTITATDKDGNIVFIKEYGGK